MLCTLWIYYIVFDNMDKTIYIYILYTSNGYMYIGYTKPQE